MKRRTLDIMFSVGGVGLAVLLLVLGLVMTSNANFAKNYTHDQLAAQKITFKAKDALTADEHFRQAGFRAVLLEDPEGG